MLAQVVAASLAVLAASPACDRPAPEPVAFTSRGFGFVAEVFPPGSRRNPGDRPRAFFYEVKHPGTGWSVDARRVWSAELPLATTPRAAIVSMDGHLVTLDEDHGTAHALAVFGRDGRLVRSFALEVLLGGPERDRATWSDCGVHWREGAVFYFTRPPDARLLVVRRDGEHVVEIALATGALRRGTARNFPALAALRSERFPSELAEVWATSLRFSSITDVQAR